MACRLATVRLGAVLRRENPRSSRAELTGLVPQTRPEQRVPGLGHPIHKVTNPRVPRLYALGKEREWPLGPRLFDGIDRRAKPHTPTP
jgi:hypothetical protein